MSSRSGNSREIWQAVLIDEARPHVQAAKEVLRILEGVSRF
jgi:hypothetical protein